MISREQKKTFFAVGTVLSIGLISFSTALFVKHIRFSPIDAATAIDPTAELVDMSFCLKSPLYNQIPSYNDEGKCYKITGTKNPHYTNTLAHLPIGHEYDPWYAYALPPPHPLPALDASKYVFAINAATVPYKGTPGGYQSPANFQQDCRGVPSTWGCYYEPKIPDYPAYPTYPASELYKFQCNGTINFKYNGQGNKLKSTIDWKTNIADSIFKPARVTYSWSGDAAGTAATSSANVVPGNTGKATVTAITYDTAGKSTSYTASCSLVVPFKPKLSVMCTGKSTKAGTVDWTSSTKVLGGDPGRNYNVDLTWRDGVEGSTETVKYPPNQNNQISAVQNSVSGNVTNVPGEVKATSPICSAEVCPIARPYEKYDWEVTWFGGQDDIRVNKKGCATERDEVTGIFTVLRDTSNPLFDPSLNCVKVPYGTRDGGGGYSEKFSITGQPFRDVNTSEIIYGAYPINNNLPDDKKIPTGCNISLKDQCMLVKAKAGDEGLMVPLWDRGAGSGKLDLSKAALRALGVQSGDHIYNAKLVPCDGSTVAEIQPDDLLEPQPAVTTSPTIERRARYLHKIAF